MARYRLKLTTLSPVHVGTADGEIKDTEFFIKGDHVHITSEKYIAEALTRENLIDNFVDFVQNESRPSMNKYLATLTRKQRANIESTITIRNISLPWQNDRIFTLRPQVNNAADRSPYIPGSTIKGALRSTLLFLLCRNNKEELTRIVARLSQARTKNKKEFARDLDRKLLQEVNLSGVKKGPNTDWLKSLNVSDAYPKEKGCTEVITVKVVSLTDNGYHYGARNTSINVEAISAGTTFTCDVIIDEFAENMLTRFNNGRKVFDFNALLENLKEKFSELLNYDRKFFNLAKLDIMVKCQDMLSKQGANFRLGWGSGLMTMTVDLLLDDKTRREIRRVFYPPRGNPNFPQSKKVVVSGGSIVNTLGWINLSWEKTV